MEIKHKGKNADKESISEQKAENVLLQTFKKIIEKRKKEKEKDKLLERRTGGPIFKLYAVFMAVIMIVITVVNYNYLGGIMGILTSEMLAVEGLKSYIVSLGCVFFSPFIAALFIWLAFIKKWEY